MKLSIPIRELKWHGIFWAAFFFLYYVLVGILKGNTKLSRFYLEEITFIFIENSVKV